MDDLRRRIERKIRKKEQEIEGLSRQLDAARSHLEGLRDSLSVFPNVNGDASGVTLRPGSATLAAYEALKATGHSMHIRDILKALGKEENRDNRMSLAGAISAYSRKGIIFTRPEPNTFGLVEFETSDTSVEDDIPPTDEGEFPELPQGRSEDGGHGPLDF